MESVFYNKKCIVEYDGIDFHGWQVQKNLRTVQGEIEEKLSKIYKKKINIIGSGRTDAGVHALGQVFSFRAEKYIPNDSLRLGLNSLLDKDVTILCCEDVPLTFHAQKSAKSKTYVYKILSGENRSSLLRNRVWWFRREIDTEKLYGYLEKFVGEHDFSSMCTKKSIKDNNIRKINFIEISSENSILNIEINANGFLHNMVRNIVGTTIFLYKKGAPFDEVEKILSKKDREEAGPTAPPQGLYLKEVFY
ncbi:MAG: tRNA pseudouridine38-40 synthase [Deferribacteres bacterium]|jgi:tRNA pseudouridine38-40 synthase|nr:tRNA pseudouridine38-40 synthase [Deferribacteres bacterium]